MATSNLRSFLRIARPLCSSATVRPRVAQDPYKTPGPTVSRSGRKEFRYCGPYEIPDQPLPEYPKRRNPYKRTSALIDALNQEEGLRLIKQGRAEFARKIPNPQAGDLIRITYVSTLAEERNPQCFMGIVMSIRKAGIGSTVVLRNVIDGIAVERGFPMYSPLIKDAEIVGKRRVKRAKLYYLREKPLRESTFQGATLRPWVTKK